MIRPLGRSEGPDADVLEVRADCYPWPSVTASVFRRVPAHGEGNDYRIHEEGIDPSPPFPSGVVERTTTFGAGALWEFGGGSSIGVDVHTPSSRTGTTSRERRREHVRPRVRQVGSVKRGVMRKLFATLEILRPHNMIAAGACVCSSYYLCGGADVGPVAWPAVFTALVTGLGNLVNDFFDADIDRVNKPHRPIPSGRLTRGYVLRLYAAGTALITTLMIFALPPAIFALMVVWEALLFTYAIKAKRVASFRKHPHRRGLRERLSGGRDGHGRSPALSIFPALFAFVFVLGREFVKGAEDVEGDRTAGARTLAVQLWSGANRGMGRDGPLRRRDRRRPMPALWCATSAARTGFSWRRSSSPACSPPRTSSSASPPEGRFGRVSWLLKIEMLLGIVVMGLGRGVEGRWEAAAPHSLVTTSARDLPLTA